MPHRRALRRLLALALPLLLLVMLTLAPPAQALDLPSWGARRQPRALVQPLQPSQPSGRLQEVAPPEAVQQLQSALADRLPQVRIESPRDGALLPDGPWQLKLKLNDWPLSEAGPLGLGAHVVVQLDALPPQRLSQSAAVQGSQRDAAAGLTLVAEEPALSPGSHRLTVYAARPWGEAVKSPGALHQITVNRLLANPLSLPPQDSPQLLPVSPADLSAGEPLLLDWILMDAPLQNLRDGDGSWRLRVSINGDRFLIDQNKPLWLRGWKPGSNALLLELLDGLGNPLNPPFNSLVQEIVLDPDGGGSRRPRWLQGRLSNDELAQLLGNKPAAALSEQAPADGLPEPFEPLEPLEPDPSVAPQDDGPQPTQQQQASPGVYGVPLPEAAAAAAAEGELPESELMDAELTDANQVSVGISEPQQPPVEPQQPPIEPQQPPSEPPPQDSLPELQQQLQGP